MWPLEMALREGEERPLSPFVGKLSGDGDWALRGSGRSVSLLYSAFTRTHDHIRVYIILKVKIFDRKRWLRRFFCV